MNNPINWEQARDLSRRQTSGPRGPMTEPEKALRRQANLEALAAGSLSSIIESRPKFTAEQCVTFAFNIANLVVERAENAREKIKTDFQVS